MLRADSCFGCRCNTLYEILAGSRSWPSAAKGCSRSAATRYYVAGSSGASTCNPVGRRAGCVFTVARWAAHPHHAKRSEVAANLVTNCHVPLNAELTSSSKLLNLRSDPEHE